MRKMNNKAFTLVELIVVITILAILATVAFISFGGQTTKAKDAKVTSDISSLAGKVNVLMLNKDKKVSEFLSGATDGLHDGVVGTFASGTTLNNTTNYKAGKLNFFTLEEDNEKFKDPSGNDYIYAYAAVNDIALFNIAGQTTDAANNNTAIVNGNYYKGASGDVTSLISASGSNVVLENAKPFTGNLY